MAAPMGPDSQTAFCPNCNQSIQTNVEQKATTKTHILALVLCVFGLCPCACCLYCTDCARNAEHYCPLCNAFLGVYER
ncbi:lipopolysaccharide-induced tumor necrosis factor-alpha factor homolog [Musca domestica]|uniref:Lipopolysaccharide-induced tumor necrosis factor-alpha factor homolog n=1 Tax=Musca domestica TaxID=7370 RepID=A0A1I8NJR8_MUSDO|nr:lipopolysaccharide-induced tumor necrosis factor-alpha factor homolog [Musca domestica]